MTRAKAIAGIFVFLVPLTVFVLTACPTVYVGDSGEMITAAFHLGIPHPPGYPLFCLLGKALSYLPLGTIAFRVNLLAALSGSAAVFVLFKLLTVISKSYSTLSPAPVLLAFATSLLFAFSTTFWSQSLMAKGSLYTMNVFFIALLIYLLYIWSDNFSPKKLFMLGLINGMALANHNIIAPLSVVFLLYILIVTWSSKNIFTDNLLRAAKVFFIYSGTALLFAFLIYLYLPIRSAANPAIDWGHPVISWGFRIEGYYAFLNHVLRKQYTVFATSPRSLALLFQQIYFYLTYLISQFTLLFFIPALPGIYACYKFSRKFFYMLLAIFLLTGFGLLLMANPQMNAIDKYTMEVFFIPSYLVLSVWIFFGFSFFASMLTSAKTAFVLTCLIFILSFLPLKLHCFQNDRSRNFVCYDYGANILRSAGPGSILFVSGDNGTFSTAYLKLVEKARPDLDIIDDYGRVFKNIYGNDFLVMAAGVYEKRVNQVQRAIINAATRPIYCIRGSNIFNMDDVKIINEGLAYRVKSLKARTPAAREISLVKRGFEDSNIYMDYWCKEIIAGYYMSEGDLFFDENNKEASKSSYKKAAEIGKDSSNIMSMLGLAFVKFDIDEALTLYKETAGTALKSPEVMNNLGVAYFKKNLIEKSISAYEEAVKMEPNYFKSYYNLGVSYNAKGDLQKAIEYFEKAAEKSPTYVDAYYGIANCYFFQRNFEKSMEYYRKTTEINPEFAIGYNGAAATLHSQGKYKEAITFYEKAISIKPDYLEAYGNLSGAYQALGDKKNAIRVLKDGLQSVPGNQQLEQMLKNIR